MAPSRELLVLYHSHFITDSWRSRAGSLMVLLGTPLGEGTNHWQSFHGQNKTMISSDVLEFIWYLFTQWYQKSWLKAALHQAPRAVVVFLGAVAGAQQWDWELHAASDAPKSRLTPEHRHRHPPATSIWQFVTKPELCLPLWCCSVPLRGAVMVALVWYNNTEIHSYRLLFYVSIIYSSCLDWKIGKPCVGYEYSV